jgi:hypothetical protein
MHLSTTVTFALALFSGVAFSSPVSTVQQGSKHTLYLSTCTRRGLGDSDGDCDLLILCPRQRSSTYSAVAYYANGGIDSGSQRNKNPTQIATVETSPWEGSTPKAKLGRAGEFSSYIDAGAKAFAKGEIAGSAKLGDEGFVCFKDGVTKITGRDELGDPEYSCVTDYWCPSIQV